MRGKTVLGELLGWRYDEILKDSTSWMQISIFKVNDLTNTFLIP